MKPTFTEQQELCGLNRTANRRKNSNQSISGALKTNMNFSGRPFNKLAENTEVTACPDFKKRPDRITPQIVSVFFRVQ
jgi:hypothetical protein